METTDRCSLCGQDEQWHIENKPQHGFNSGSGSLNKKKEKVPVKVMSTSGDPALRMALIEAGVITYAQLAMAEEKLHAARESGEIAQANTPGGPGTTNGGSGPSEGTGSGH